MIEVKLQGGLGNQMFQYALGRSLAEKNKDDLTLDLTFVNNRSFRKDFSYRNFNLSVFNINEKTTFLSKLSSKIVMPGVFPKVSNLINKAKDVLGTQEYVFENDIGHFDENILSLKGNIYLDGYWQNEEYFEDVKKIIRKEFTFKSEHDSVNLKTLEDIRNSNSVSLHIRRGDYINIQKISRIYQFLGLDYYRKAIDVIKNRVKDPSFFIFSDDISWAKENLKIDSPIYFIDHNGPGKSHEDLRLMSICKHNIIANSTFGWWGAWLNNNPNKTVVAPKNWFSEEEMKRRGGFDIVPCDWIKI